MVLITYLQVRLNLSLCLPDLRIEVTHAKLPDGLDSFTLSFQDFLFYPPDLLHCRDHVVGEAPLA